MRTRRSFLVLIGASLFGALGRVMAQGPGRTWRVGVLAGRKRAEPFDSDPLSRLPERLRELGYVEGRNLVMEWRFADSDYARLPGLAAELVRLRVDVIVAADGTAAALAAKGSTATTPVVFVNVADPVAVGLVQSLARPGGNATGIALIGNDYAAKQMEMLTSLAPGLNRVAVLLNPLNAGSGVVLEALRVAARATRVAVRPIEAATPAAINDAFAVLEKERTRALIVVWDTLFFQQRLQIAELATASRIASIGGAREYAQSGGLISYGQDRVTTTRRAADFVDKVLRGTSPTELPVEMPAKQELVINRKTARALGLTVPPDLLVLADKVIE